MRKPPARTVHTIMRALAAAIDQHDLPAVEKIAEESQEDPFEVLISTMLSAQTRDPVTAAASARLFRVARTPRTMAKLTTRRIERLIYPVSFYRHKAKHVQETCRLLVARYRGRVPGTMEELLTLPGVGRKTANLVLILSFKSLRNICVDTHVHRISNRLGWVQTRTPEETEQAVLDERLNAQRCQCLVPDVNVLLCEQAIEVIDAISFEVQRKLFELGVG